jgi:hypothetical protein
MLGFYHRIRGFIIKYQPKENDAARILRQGLHKVETLPEDVEQAKIMHIFAKKLMAV